MESSSSESYIKEYLKHGFTVIPDFLSSDELAALRAECDNLYTQAIESCDSTSEEEKDETSRILDNLHERGYVVEAISAGDYPGESSTRRERSDYVRARRSNTSSGAAVHKAVENVLFSNQRLCSILLEIFSSSAKFSKQRRAPMLFNEQYIVKPGGDLRTTFAWHTDEREQMASMYLGGNSDAKAQNRDYVSLWLPLDNVGEENGTLVVLPRLDGDITTPPCTDEGIHTPTKESKVSHGDGESTDDHKPKRRRLNSPILNDGKFLEDRVTLVEKAGSAVLFSSSLWHSSLPNRSKERRRVFYVQYSAHPILAPSGTPLSFAIPLVINPTQNAENGETPPTP